MGASKISATRLAAVIASWVIDSRKPSDAIGHTSDSIMVMNATSVPIVTRPWPAAYAPKPSTRINVRFGMTSSNVQNLADTVTFSHLGAVQHGSLLVEAVEDVLLTPERLDDPHAERRFLHVRGHARRTDPAPAVTAG